jgi:hypothetical protein
MTELKDDIAAERDELRAENERLRAQLAAAGGSPRAYQPAQQFQLSEGDRQELVTRGVVTINGRRMTREDVENELDEDQRGVDLGDADPVDAGAPGVGERSAIRGVDYVYPSVAPGLIDPDVAGTPGINGPAAER